MSSNNTITIKIDYHKRVSIFVDNDRFQFTPEFLVSDETSEKFSEYLEGLGFRDPVLSKLRFDFMDKLVKSLDELVKDDKNFDDKGGILKPINYTLNFRSRVAQDIMLGGSLYRTILAYLKQSRSIPVDEGFISSLVDIISDSLDKVPGVLKSKGYDIKEIISNLDEKDEDFLPGFFSIFDDIFYKDPRRDALRVDFHVTYRPQESEVSALQMRGSTVEIVFGKKFLSRLIYGWYYLNEKKKYLSEFSTLLGHELVHSQQGGKFVLRDKIQNLGDDILKEIGPYRPKLSESAKGLNGGIIEYIENNGRRAFMQGFSRFYKSLLGGSIKSVPPYFLSYYESIKSFLPAHLIKPAMDHMARKVDDKFYSKYTDFSEEKEWYSYISDPKEIMAYAYSLVSKAHKEKFSREGLIRALSDPDKYKDVLYPLDFYRVFKDFKDDKNFSSSEKKKIWQKFLKHVSGYIDQIYGGPS